MASDKNRLLISGRLGSEIRVGNSLGVLYDFEYAMPLISFICAVYLTFIDILLNR